MKKPMLLFAFLIVSAVPHGHAQYNIDSLQNLLQTTGEDTTRINILRDLSWGLIMISEFERAMQYAVEMKSMVEKLNANKPEDREWRRMDMHLARAYFNIGEINRNQGDYAESIRNIDFAIKIYERHANNQGLAMSLYVNGMTHFQQGDFADALEDLSGAEKAYEADSNRLGVAYVYNIIGNIYNQEGNYAEALKQYMNSLKICEELNSDHGKCSVYTNIGIILEQQKDYAEALKYYTASLEINQRLGDKTQVALNYDHIGLLQVRMDECEAAVENLLKARQLSEEIGDKNMYAYACNHLGEAYIAEGNYAEAVKSNIAALTIMEEIGDKYGTGSACVSIGTAYAELGQPENATTYYNKGLQLAKDIGNKNGALVCYQRLASLYGGMQDYKNAYTHHRLYAQMNDSVYNEEKSRQLAEIQTEYETEKKDVEIELLMKDQALHLGEIKRQRLLKYGMLSGFAVFLVMSVFVYDHFRTRQKLKVQTMRNKIASDLHDDVGSALTSIRIYTEMGKKQTESHDLSNTFAKIDETAGDMIQSMSDIVWMINPKYDAFSFIVRRMETFASEFLGAKGIQYRVTKEKGVEDIKLLMEKRKNIFLIFKEALNNTAKHAHCQHVDIEIAYIDNDLQLIITDDGVGFDEKIVQPGNGLSNMQERAAEVGGRISVQSTKGRGVCIRVQIPV